MLMYAATKTASRRNAPFITWGFVLIGLYGGLLWSGPKIESAVAPPAHDLQISAIGHDTFILTADVRNGCEFTYLKMETAGPIDKSGRRGLTAVEHHVLTPDPLRVLIRIDPGNRVLPGSQAVFSCPLLPWYSKVPIRWVYAAAD